MKRKLAQKTHNSLTEGRKVAENIIYTFYSTFGEGQLFLFQFVVKTTLIEDKYFLSSEVIIEAKKL